MFTQNRSFTLLIPKCDAVVLGASHLKKMRRLPEDWNLEKRCEKLNTIIATLCFILYLCTFTLLSEVKTQLRTLCVIVADVVQILFVLTPHFSQTGFSPVI
jgi:hypothetical protein